MGAHKVIAKILTVLLFGLLIISFAAWGIGDIFRGGQRMQTVAEVGDVVIDQTSFSTQLTRQLNNFSAQFGTRIGIDQARQLGLDRQVLRSMIGRALLQNDVERLGMVVSTSQVKKMIAATPVFRDQFGSFDPNIFAQVLRNQGLSEQAYVDRLKSDIVARRLSAALSEAVKPPQTLAELIYKFENEKRIASYIELANPTTDEIKSPETSVLEEFYQSNQASFQAPAYRSVTLVHLKTEDLAKEISIPDEKVSQAFEARRDDLSIPERRTLEQIRFSSEEEAKAAYERLKDGTAFETIAEGTTGQAPVSLGTSDGSGLLPELRDAAFALENAGDVTSPVRSPLGWHLIKVSEIRPFREAKFEDHRENLKKELAEAAAIDASISLANALNEELGAGNSLEDAAANLGVELRKIEAIDRGGLDRSETRLEGLPRNFTASVFEEDVGETSALKEDGQGGYYVMRVDSSLDPKLRPFDEVKDDALALWRNAEAVRLAREEAQAISDRIAGGESLETIAEERGVVLETTQPLLRNDSDSALVPTPGFASRIFALNVDEIATSPSEDGYLVFRLDEVIPADPAGNSEGFQQTQEALSEALRADLFDLYMSGLEEEIGVTVNEAVLNQTLQAF